MKRWFIVGLLAASFSTYANTVLTCSTIGDALDGVYLEETSQGNKLRITYLDESEETFDLDRSFKYIKKKDSDTLIGQKKDSIQFGGAISDAMLIRVFKGGKSARLAANGQVYFLNCFDHK